MVQGKFQISYQFFIIISQNPKPGLIPELSRLQAVYLAKVGFLEQSTGKIGEERLALFVAGDDAKAKQTVMQLGKDIGFDPVDAGPLKSARYLEPMGMLMINLGYNLGMGPKIGIKLVRA